MPTTSTPNTEFRFNDIKASNRLPSPSGVALAIMQLIESDDASLKGLIELVSVDPALNGRILSFANSSFFGAGRPIASVSDAIRMMGMHTVRNFALSLSLVNNRGTDQCPNFNYDAYWSRSLLMAVSLGVVGEKNREISATEAFTLGLLSNIGSLAFASVWSDVYSECLNMANGDALLTMERERFAIDHEELAVMILRDWGLPEIFSEALKLSFNPIASEELSRGHNIAKQINIADQLATYCVADNDSRLVLLPGIQEAIKKIGFTDDELDALIENIIAQYGEWGALMKVDTTTNVVSICVANEGLTEVVPDKDTGFLNSDVLLVGDDLQTMAMIARRLIENGHRAVVCRDGKSALNQVVANAPQIIIIDWQLKSVAAAGLCKVLRQTGATKNIYIIAVTESSSDDDTVLAFSAGVDAYVLKKTGIEVLLAHIQAGQRVSALQQEVEREKQEIHRFSSELAVANRRLVSMANTDVLTGLPNRRHALQRLEQEWSVSQRNQQPLCVMILDLDHFKLVNDTLGHDAGDAVLNYASRIMKAAIRPSDTVCRYGGEEFLIISPNTGFKTGVLLADRVRKTIESNQPKNLALVKPVTVSIGISCSVGDRPGWSELIKFADEALYEVKQSGRNSIKLSDRLLAVEE